MILTALPRAPASQASPRPCRALSPARTRSTRSDCWHRPGAGRGHHRDTAGVEHAHRHRGPRPRQPGNDDDGGTATQSAEERRGHPLLQWSEGRDSFATPPPWLTLTWTVCLILISAAPALAYIGPGAGFALMSSAFVLVTTVSWSSPRCWHGRSARCGGCRATQAAEGFDQAIIVVGLDGQDPKLTDRFMKEGLLPHFSALAAEGSYRRLTTTFPSLSPVAWSSFSTGAHPARHNIFDFLDRDRRTYLPMLSSTHIGKVKRFLRLGKWRIPLQRPELRLLADPAVLDHPRRAPDSRTVLRVPITFPPDRFYGAELSAMCVPDLLGTQGTFPLYTTRPAGTRFKEGGLRYEVVIEGNNVRTAGTENTFARSAAHPAAGHRAESRRQPSRWRSARPASNDAHRAQRLGGAPLRGRAWHHSRGLTRLLVPELGDHFSLYVAPINLDPGRRRCHLASAYARRPWPRRWGPTRPEPRRGRLGVQRGRDRRSDVPRADLRHRPRARGMFFAALDRLDGGGLVFVFDAADVSSSCSARYDAGHPAARGRDKARHRHAIRELYAHNDALIRRLREHCVAAMCSWLSDHGLASLSRGVNLKRWLLREGYLALKPAPTAVRNGFGTWTGPGRRRTCSD